MELKHRVKAARAHSGLNQTQLGKAIGVSQTTIADLETARSRSSTHLFAIARVCGVSPAWLIDERGAMLADSIQVLEEGPEYKADKATTAAKSLAEAIVRHALAGLLTVQDIEALKAMEIALSKKGDTA